MQIHLMMIARKLRLRYPAAKSLELDPGINLRNEHDFIMFPEMKCLG